MMESVSVAVTGSAAGVFDLVRAMRTKKLPYSSEAEALKV